MSTFNKYAGALIGVTLGFALVLYISLHLQAAALTEGSPLGSWFTLVNLNHNGFHTWRLDHLSQLATYFAGNNFFADRPVIGLLVLTFGSVLFIRTASAAATPPRNLPLVLGCLPAVFVLLAAGLDTVVIGTLAWIPLLAVTGCTLLSNPRSPLHWTVLVFVGVQNCLSANQASLISAFMALGLIALIRHSSQESSEDTQDAWIMLVIVLLIPTAITAAIAPTPTLPRYPRSAHVVPFEDLEQTIQPLIGPSYPFESLHRSAAKSLYSPSTEILLGATALLLLLGSVRSKRLTSRLLSAGLALSFCALLDTHLTNSWSSIAPLESASRLLPWGTHYSIVSIAVGASAWALGYGIIMGRILPSAALGVASITLLIRHTPVDLQHPYLRRIGLTENPEIAHILSTPSVGIFRTYSPQNPDILQWIQGIRHASSIPSKESSALGAQVSLSPEPKPEVLERARNLEKSWRWSTRTGSQRGDELLTVKFPQPLSVRGVEIDPGVYYTDYPRGLRIAGGHCSDQNSATVLYEAQSWQGTLHATPRGAPYFAPRNEVRVIFANRSEPIECLFIQQTGKADNDWSISRVRIVE